MEIIKKTFYSYLKLTPSWTASMENPIYWSSNEIISLEYKTFIKDRDQYNKKETNLQKTTNEDGKSFNGRNERCSEWEINGENIKNPFKTQLSEFIRDKPL